MGRFDGPSRNAAAELTRRLLVPFRGPLDDRRWSSVQPAALSRSLARELYAHAHAARPTAPKRERKRERARQRRARWPTRVVQTSRALRASVRSTLPHRPRRCTPQSRDRARRMMRVTEERYLLGLLGGTTNGTTCSRPSKPTRYSEAERWVENGPMRTLYQVPRPETFASTT